MPFFIRKALSVGPFRFNLSKSGIGLSTGIKGLRLGMGPRGNYIYAGRYGMYYRATLPKFGQAQGAVPVELPREIPNFEGLTEIASGSVLQMTDSTSADLLKELNEKNARIRLWPIMLLATIAAVTGLTLAQLHPGLYVIASCVGVIATIAAAQYDKMKKSVVLFYNLDDEVMRVYQGVHTAFDKLDSCEGKWHIEAKGRTDDWKYHAGASYLVRRNPTQLHNEMPAWLKTNISVPVIPIGRRELYFFPDRLLMVDSGKVGAVSYDSMNLSLYEQRFIEDEGVPGDAQVVDRTWRYVNKKGGPDRRFANNRELPVLLYAYLQLTSPSGLNELLAFSRRDPLQAFVSALVELSKCTKHEVPVPLEPPANIKFLCPSCGQSIEAEGTMAVQVASCPTCKNSLTVPTA
jgi:hypothetical protein